MFFLQNRLGKVAKKALLGSATVVNLAGMFVENVVCTLLESIGLGVWGYGLKSFVSPNEVLDVVLVDIGMSIMYVLYGLPVFRTWFHDHFKHPCRKLGRKILGLDIRDQYAFLKIKYTCLFLGSCIVLVSLEQITDLKAMIRLCLIETMVVHGIIDTWKLKKTEIQEYLEPLPKTKIVTQADHEICLQKKQLPAPSPKPLPKVLLGSALYPDYMGVYEKMECHFSQNTKNTKTDKNYQDGSMEEKMPLGTPPNVTRFGRSKKVEIERCGSL